MTTYQGPFAIVCPQAGNNTTSALQCLQGNGADVPVSITALTQSPTPAQQWGLGDDARIYQWGTIGTTTPLCLDYTLTTSGYPADGASVQLNGVIANQSSQAWYWMNGVTAVAGSAYLNIYSQLTDSSSNYYSLDDPNGNGSILQIWQALGGSNQMWTFVSLGA